MEQAQLLAHCGSSKITRDELKRIQTPEASPTHQPIPHNQIVEALMEGLSFRHISAMREEYAVSNDGMKMFGVLDLETTFDGCRFSVGIRNSNDKSMRLAVTVGYRVLTATTWRFTEISRRSWRSTANTSVSSTCFPSGSTAFSGISSQ